MFFLIMLLLGFAGSPPKGTNSQRHSVVYAEQEPQFVIADLDGDHLPDVASIQTGSSSGYWIQLQFSASTRRSIQLVAPAGGLLIEARDVNGDHAVDLVFATALFRKPVAIFLNDGHGGFSRAEPARFPEAFSQHNAKLDCKANQIVDATGLPSESRAGSGPEGARPPDFGLRATSSFASTPQILPHDFLICHAGRAPPRSKRDFSEHSAEG